MGLRFQFKWLGVLGWVGVLWGLALSSVQTHWDIGMGRGVGAYRFRGLGVLECGFGCWGVGAWGIGSEWVGVLGL